MKIEQERDRVRGRLVVTVFIVSVVVGFAAIGATAGFLVGRSHAVANAEERPSPAPVAREKRLHEYGWVDRDKAIAHIPIERAIDIVSQETP